MWNTLSGNRMRVPLIETEELQGEKRKGERRTGKRNGLNCAEIAQREIHGKQSTSGDKMRVTVKQARKIIREEEGERKRKREREGPYKIFYTCKLI